MNTFLLMCLTITCVFAFVLIVTWFAIPAFGRWFAIPAFGRWLVRRWGK